jgi:ABC-type Na+ efflux pump permease subunit
MAIVTHREWMSGPVWNCFRTDFRRRWRARNIVRALGILLLIGGLQLGLSLAVQRLWATPGWLGLMSLMSAFGLYSPLTQAFGGGFRSASPKIPSYVLIQGIFALPWLACHFLMPASAANSVVPDRERRRLSELILAGLTPRQILVAKGLAAVLPFLAAAVAALIATCVAYLLARVADPVISYGGFSPRALFLSEAAVATTSWLLSAAIQVCISALSRRTLSAIVICYGFQCLLVPILSLLSQFGWPLAFWMLASRTSASAGWGFSLFLAPQLTVVVLLAVTLLLLWPRALRALAYPE